MTTSLKKAPEVTLRGFHFVNMRHCYSILSVNIIAYADLECNINIFEFFCFL